MRRQLSACLMPSAALAASLFLFATPVAAQTFMSEDELLATIPGSTIDGKTDQGEKWVQAYSAFDGKKKKGVIAGKSGGADFKSKWYVENGQWCENWGDGHACFQVERVSKKELRMYRDGKARPNLWVLR
ncbi:MAG: hypothetical protein H6895_13735 [Defluviimonas sp.]|uniref:hypothetical protein n=1 Tax=Albidovulum sp. TaxID=1872424 RepID=UPI002A26728E|nr:hypothetical protein [Defluviimonas sp.]